jgi:hypothetical protein
MKESLHQENLFGRPDVQEAQELRDVMSQQGNARDQDTQEPNLEMGPYGDNDALDEDDQYSPAIESECSIVDETVRPSLMKTPLSPRRTRNGGKVRRALVVPEPYICSDVEDDDHRHQIRKRNTVIKTPLKAGATAKYLRRNSTQFPSIASKTLARPLQPARRGPARRDSSDQVKHDRQRR